MHVTLLRFIIPSLFIGGVVSAYDYVVIGGGNGGSVVASRLSENPDVQVLVIEAGPNAESIPEVFIPGLAGTGAAAALNWKYQTVPQENMNGRQLSVGAGKALGGSTIINSMIASRAAKAQYDAIGILNNSTDWTWNSLMDYFRRAEVLTAPNSFQSANGANYDASVHGPTSLLDEDKGAVKVGFPNYYFPQSEMFAQTLMSDNSPMGLKYERAEDLADGDVGRHVGVACNTLDAANNTRCSAACGYITPFLGVRKNLQVITNAMVSKILWDDTKKANGSIVAKQVEYYLDGDSTPKYADVDGDKGEVILAAGTIGTPKVIELSGVGNSSLLKDLGINVVLDLPSVGENFADHVHSWATSTTNASLTKDVLQQNKAFAAEQLDMWYQNRSGLYSAAPRSLALTVPSDLVPKDRLSTLISDARNNMDNYVSRYANGNSKLEQGIKLQHQISLDLYEQDQQLPSELNIEPGYSGPTSVDKRGNLNFTTISAVFYNPLSRGRTHVKSTDYNTPPAVDPAYWSHPIDVAMHVASLQVARKLLRTPPLQSIYVEEYEPGAHVESDEDVEAYLKTVAGSDNHEVGTMSMMPEALGGVVDTRFRVYGLENVRVVDASVIPMPISSHMESTVYMLGEKAAELIMQERSSN